MIIGITGKYGAGKDEISRLLVNKGFSEINLDAIGHRVLEEQKPKIVDTFGKYILNQNGEINRRLLGCLVFSDKNKLKLLEEIVHPRMVELAKERLNQLWGHKVINAALLFKLGLHTECDSVLIVKAPFWLRFWRAYKRDKLSYCQTICRFLAQRKLIPKKSSLKVDIYYINNSGSRKILQKRLESRLSQIRAKERQR